MLLKNIFKAALLAVLSMVLFALGCNLFPSDSDSQLPLKDVTNQADYLIVSPNNFINDLKPFVEFKQAKGLNIRVTSLEQIYNEFPVDSLNAESIRDFISYTLQFWQTPKPKYVLLAGDTDIIPIFKLPSSFANISNDIIQTREDSVSLDEPYSINTFQQDSIPDIAVGRFPVSTTEALSNLITKTIQFEQTLPQLYASKLLMLVDESEDFNNFFEQWAEGLLNNSLNNIEGIQRVDIRENSNFHSDKGTLFQKIKAGTYVFSYMGFGSSSSLSRTNFITLDDINQLNETQKLFMAFLFTSSQYYDITNEKSIVEKMLNIPNGGAVVSIAPTGLAFASLLRRFSQKLFENLNAYQSIGEVFLLTKQEVLSEQGASLRADDTIRRFSLLGDPSLTINF